MIDTILFDVETRGGGTNCERRKCELNNFVLSVTCISLPMTRS